MLLYHGSNVIVEKPHLVEQTRGLDFGPGFYLTTSEEQASRFSMIVFNRRKTGSGIVNTYEFDIVTAEKTLRVHRFDNAHVEWLRFVRADEVKKAYRYG
jgi:hypothetical protein